MTDLSNISDQEIIDFVAKFGSAQQAINAIADLPAQPRPADRPKPAIPDTPVVVSVDSLTKSYKVGKTKVDALRGVSIDIHEGEFIALTGSSGSGKSTLLQIIGGLDKPSSGKVEIMGTNLAKLSDTKLSTFRNQTIGFVFQFFYLQPFLNVSRNIEVAAMFAGAKRSDRKSSLQAVAQAVGLSDRANHMPNELSGGQMQRVAIARALLNRPKLILADEPTGNLDSANGKQIIDLFESIRKQFGTTVIVVTHDQKIADRADREIKLADGELL